MSLAPASERTKKIIEESMHLFVKQTTVEYLKLRQMADSAVSQSGRAEIGPLSGIGQGGKMGVSEILAAVDREIALLQQARALLGGSAAPAPKKAVGRPRKIVAAPKKVAAAPAAKPEKKKKRNLSPEGRARIAEAVKRRWAAQKAAAAK